MNRVVKSAIPLLAAFALAAPALLSPAPAAAAVTLDAEEEAAIKALNEARIDTGLDPFTVSPILTEIAEFMAGDNARRDTLDHTDALGRGLRDRNNAFGYPANTVIRENLAAGREGGTATMDQWMNSPGHRANNYADDVIAVGIARVFREGSTYGWFWALEFGSHADAGSVSIGVGSTRPPAANAPVGSGLGTFSMVFPERGVGLNVWNGGSLALLTGGAEAGGATAVFISAEGRFTGYVIGAPAFVNQAFLDRFPSGEVPAGTPMIIVR